MYVRTHFGIIKWVRFLRGRKEYVKLLFDYSRHHETVVLTIPSEYIVAGGILTVKTKKD